MAETPEDWPALIWQQQRELAQLRHSQEELLQRLCAQLEGLQSTVTGHVERALESRHEQERILGGKGTAGTGMHPCSLPRTGCGTSSGSVP